MLATFWLWNGLIYHHGHFSAINPAAHVFGALSVVQGLLFLWAGIVRPGLPFDLRGRLHPAAGVALIAYAMLAYPLLGHAVGHGYPRAPLFGVAPCPTTIFTLGILLLARTPLPTAVLVIPLLWSLVGGTAAILLNVPEDLGLWAAGLVALWLSLHHRARRQSAAARVREPSALDRDALTTLR